MKSMRNLFAFCLIFTFFAFSCGPTYRDLPQVSVASLPTGAGNPPRNSVTQAQSQTDNTLNTTTDEAVNPVQTNTANNLNTPNVGSLSGEYLVRTVYLVPSDKNPNSSYELFLRKAMENLQIWFRNQMGNGSSFRLNNPVVEIYKTPHESKWYSTNVTKDNTFETWNRIIADGFALTGGKYADPHNRWIFLIDIDYMCGQAPSAGEMGVAALCVTNNIRLIKGENLVPTCPGDNNYAQAICVWVALFGHELGHTFGLPDRYPSPPHSDYEDNSIMGGKMCRYPNTYLVDEDKATLNQSPFFQQINLPSQLPDCASLAP